MNMCVCVCVYEYIYLCVYMYIYMCVCVYIYVCVCEYIYIYIYIYIYVCMYICVCIYSVYMCVYIYMCVCVGRNSSVNIATRYGLDGPRIKSRWGPDFPHLSRTALGPTQPPVHWLPGLSWGKVRPGRDADFSPSSSAVVMKE